MRQTTIHKQFGSGDVAAVILRQKHHGFADLIGFTESAQRGVIGYQLLAFEAHIRRSQKVAQSWRVYRARAHSIHANVAIF